MGPFGGWIRCRTDGLIEWMHDAFDRKTVVGFEPARILP
jgi:hypothetical protein